MRVKTKRKGKSKSKFANWDPERLKAYHDVLKCQMEIMHDFEVQNIPMKDIMTALRHHGLGDFESSRKHAESLGTLEGALRAARNDAGYSRITRAATKLLLVDSLIDIEIDSGNEDLCGNLASGLLSVLRGCFYELKSMLSSAAAADKEESKPTQPTNDNTVAA